MSQWTHFLGVIRFESLHLNIWPEPRDKNELINNEVNFVHKIFQTGFTPTGSEGPVQIDTIITERGPTVLITGDLRDFGLEDLDKVVSWINDRVKVIKDKKMGLYVRDAIINCDVEYNNDTLLIIEDEDNQKFELITYNSV